MSTIAKGEITLTTVNDAYTVLVTPASCIIKADFDGSNPNLENAKGSIFVKRGEKDIPFKVTSVDKSPATTHVLCQEITPNKTSFSILQVNDSIQNGYVDFNIQTLDGLDFTAKVRFSFSVIRESSMLDWIQDWESSKTKIGGTYIMTPKLFVGKKEDIIAEVNGVPTWKSGALTGVYIGPDILATGESGAGIYGYLKDKKIFHINADGGFIGGWTFNNAGLQSVSGAIQILSEGSIIAQSPNTTTPYWGCYADGHALFANGNVKFEADGSAEFAGKITSASGTIGGWSITQNQLYSERLIIDSKEGYIGINASKMQSFDIDTGNLLFPEEPTGGLKMWYKSAVNYGMVGWSASHKVFQLGSNNYIAGWRFNHQAIWTGDNAPSLVQGDYASNTGALTIAPNGIRSTKWYIDANGTASFVGGLVKFDVTEASMFGWKMRDKQFSAKHAVLASDEASCGLFLSPSTINDISTDNLASFIDGDGGIYLYANDTTTILKSVDSTGNVGFTLNNTGDNIIAGWKFNHQAIFTHEMASSGYATEGIVLSPLGLRGQCWRIEQDGSGAFASGHLVWDTSGNITLLDSSLKIVDEQNNVSALFDSNGHITASLINVESVECRDQSDNHLLAGMNREGDGAFCIYYPSGHIMMRYGYEKRSDGIESVAQHFLEDGTMDWVISPTGTNMSAIWHTIDYWSTKNYSAQNDFLKGTATLIYSLNAVGTGTLFYYSEPNTTKLFNGTVWALKCYPQTEEDGRKAAYRSKWVISDGREVSREEVFMGYPSSDFNWETGE